MTLDWEAEVRERVLPNIDADLVVHSIIPRGPGAVTAISVVGNFAAPQGLVQGFEQVWFTRRVLNRVVVSFVDSLTRLIDLELTPKRVALQGDGKTLNREAPAA